MNLENSSLSEKSRFDAFLFWALLLAVLGAATATVSSTLYVIFHEYLPLPHSDEWDMIAQWNDRWHNADSGWWHLFDQHNEHRIALPRLVFFADLGWFRATWIFTLGCLILIQLFHALLLHRLISASMRCQVPSNLIVAGIVMILMFSALQIRNLVWGFQVQFVGVFFFASLAFYFLLRPPSGQTTSEPPWKSSFLIGVFFCIAATFTMANGLLVWLVGLMIGVQQKWSLKRLLIFLVLASIAWLAYFSDFQFVSGHSNPWDGFENLWILAQYVAIYLGHPISPFWREYAMGIGFLGIFSTTFLGIRFLLDRGQNLYTTPAAGTLFGISVFVLLTAAITALGRIEFGLEQATSSRYATPALIYWIATCTVLFSIKLQSQFSRRFLRCLGTALGFSAIASAIAFQLKAPEISKHLTLTRSAATASLLSKVYDESALKQIYPRPPQIMNTVDTLREGRLSLFSMDIAKLIAQPLEQFLSIVSKRSLRRTYR